MPKIYGVTTQTSDSTDQRIGIIKKTTDGFAYSVDGSTFETISTGGSSGGGSKGFDYVIAPSDSGVTDGVDLVLPGTADQTAINNLITTITSSGKKSATIKFLGGTVKLTDTINISNAIINFISDGTTTLQMTEAKTIFNYNYFGSNEGFVRLEGLIIETAAITPVTLKSTSMNNVLVSNCFFKTYLSVDVSGGNLVIENCNVNNSTQITPGASNVILLYGCNFSNINVDSELGKFYVQACKAGDFTCKKFAAIDSSTFNGNFTTGGEAYINFGSISNCHFIGNVNVSSESECINITNCTFGDPSERMSMTITYGNCIFTNCYFINFNGTMKVNDSADMAASFDSCTFDKIVFTENTIIGFCANCILRNITINVSNGTVAFNEMNNCQLNTFNFKNVGNLTVARMRDCRFTEITCTYTFTGQLEDTNSALISCMEMTNCIFDTWNVVPYHQNLISSLEDSETSFAINCEFLEIIIDCSNLGPSSEPPSFSILKNFKTVTGCNFPSTKISNIPPEFQLYMIRGASKVSDVIFASITGLISGGQQIPILISSDLTTDMSITNVQSSWIGTAANDGIFLESASSNINLNNIHLAQSLLIKINNDLATHGMLNINNFTIDSLSTQGFILVNSSTIDHIKITDLSILGQNRDANLIDFSAVNDKSVVIQLSNATIQYSPEYTFKFHNIRNDQKILAICDNVYIANGDVLESYFNTFNSATLYYSNYTSDLLGNYSSNVALKNINERPWIYNDEKKTWLPLAVGYVTYGVQVDLRDSNPSTSCTYTDDAVGMTPGTSWLNKLLFKDIKPCLLDIKTNKVFNYLNPDDFSQFEDNSPGAPITNAAYNVMIEFPKIGYKIVNDGLKLTVQITNDPNKEGFSYGAFTRNSEGDRDKLYIGAFMGTFKSEAAGNRLVSLSGTHLSPVEGKITAFRTATEEPYGDSKTGYDVLGFNQLVLLQCLYLIMYKNLNSQATLGLGIDQGPLSIASTLSKGMCYGSTTNDALAMKFLGIENLWGNGGEFIEGVQLDSSGYLWVGTTEFNDDKTGYTQSDSVIGSTLTGGFISDVKGTNFTGFVPTTFNGSATTYFCDNGMIVPASGSSPTFGAGSSTSKGIFNLSFNSTTSGESHYARLMYL